MPNNYVVVPDDYTEEKVVLTDTGDFATVRRFKRPLSLEEGDKFQIDGSNFTWHKARTLEIGAAVIVTLVHECPDLWIRVPYFAATESDIAQSIKSAKAQCQLSRDIEARINEHAAMSTLRLLSGNYEVADLDFTDLMDKFKARMNEVKDLD